MSVSSVANNGTIQIEPEPKRRRLLDAGGPIEDDETARKKMSYACVFNHGELHPTGFDPDNVADIQSYLPLNTQPTNHIKPMGYFARLGDLPMMRWLYVNGADTRDMDVAIFFPMYLAAQNGQAAVCRWLFDHGAAKDVKRRTRENRLDYPNGSSPLTVTFSGCFDTSISNWLILNGALCKDDDSGELDVEIMKKDIDHSWLIEERELLLEWANNLHRPRTSFLLFLSGALSGPNHGYSTRRIVSPLQLLAGQPGLRELIGDYVGFVRGREARIIRQLTEMLPDLI